MLSACFEILLSSKNESCSLTFTGWQSVVLQWPFCRDAACASGFLELDPGKATSLEKLELLSETCHIAGSLLNTALDF